MNPITIHPQHFAAYKASYDALNAAIHDNATDRKERDRLQAEHLAARDAYSDIHRLRNAADDAYTTALVNDADEATVEKLQAEYRTLQHLAALILNV